MLVYNSITEWLDAIKGQPVFVIRINTITVTS